MVLEMSMKITSGMYACFGATSATKYQLSAIGLGSDLTDPFL